MAQLQHCNRAAVALLCRGSPVAVDNSPSREAVARMTEDQGLSILWIFHTPLSCNYTAVTFQHRPALSIFFLEALGLISTLVSHYLPRLSQMHDGGSEVHAVLY